VVIIFSANQNYGQETACPCCAEQYQQFDFWLGDWNVYDTTGALVGTNKITKSQYGCILVENWASKKSDFTSTSYNFFNKSDSTWNQTWVDNKGGSLILKGRLTDGKMVLSSDLLKGQKVDWYFNRITWTPQANGNVTQLWEIVGKDSVKLKTAFFGIYKRKN